MTYVFFGLWATNIFFVIVTSYEFSMGKSKPPSRSCREGRWNDVHYHCCIYQLFYLKPNTRPNKIFIVLVVPKLELAWSSLTEPLDSHFSPMLCTFMLLIVRLRDWCPQKNFRKAYNKGYKIKWLKSFVQTWDGTKVKPRALSLFLKTEGYY